MKKLITIAIGLFFSFFFCANAQTIFYVSSEASDKGDGRINNPFKTIESALQKSMNYVDDDTVFIQLQSGIYALDKTIRIKESSSVPIVIQGDANSKTILSGGIELSSWKETPQGWWKTHINQVDRFGLKIEQLYVNGRRATRARTPDVGQFFLQGSSEVVHYQGPNRRKSRGLPLYATQRLLVDAEDLTTLANIPLDEQNNVMAMFYHKWDNTRKYLNFVQVDSGYIFLNGKGMKSWNSLQKGTRFVLENYKEALTVEGEWFLDKMGDLYYIPRKGEDIELATAYAPVLKCLLSIEGQATNLVENITFRNITFAHIGYVMPTKGDDPAQAASSVNAAIELDFIKNINFEHCEVKHTGNYAIWFRRACSYSSLKNSYLYDLGAGGVKIGELSKSEGTYPVTNNIIVENNIIQKAGNVFPCGVGIAIFQAANNRIIHNEISDLLYSGISVGWTWGYGKSFAVGNEIAYNHVHHIGWGELSDMGAVYTLGKSPGTRIHHNSIHDVYSYDYGGWGLYTDEGSSDIIMENNLVYACKSGGFHQHYGKENIIKNNIFAFNHSYQLQFTRMEKHQSFSFTNNIVLMDHGVLFDTRWATSEKGMINMNNNCYWDLRADSIPRFLNQSFKEWEKTKDSNSVVANPYFKDPYNLDFHFKSKKTIQRINFKPFDYEKAGVYGSEEWKNKAQLSEERKEQFRRVIRQREKTFSGINREK